MAIFMSALWDTFPPHEVCREGCCPLTFALERETPSTPTGAGITGLEAGELVPKARLHPGTPTPDTKVNSQLLVSI